LRKAVPDEKHRVGLGVEAVHLADRVAELDERRVRPADRVADAGDRLCQRTHDHVLVSLECGRAGLVVDAAMRLRRARCAEKPAAVGLAAAQAPKWRMGAAASLDAPRSWMYRSSGEDRAFGDRLYKACPRRFRRMQFTVKISISWLFFSTRLEN